MNGWRGKAEAPEAGSGGRAPGDTTPPLAPAAAPGQPAVPPRAGLVVGSWAAVMLAAIAAPDEDAKAAILAEAVPPADGAAWPAPDLPPRPGRPADLRIEAHPPRRRQGLGTPHGRLRFLHAIWHIEISAIDLACVACLRGAGMPGAFHADWLRIAREEAQHARMVRDLLTARGWPPGSEPVHLRLWETTRACADLGEHLACVPRVLEARGLDVNADLLPRVAPVDAGMHAVLHRIYLDEIGHVGAGTRWHRHWCAERGQDPEAHYADACARVIGDLRSPFPVDVAGRRAAGFTEHELGALTGNDGARGESPAGARIASGSVADQ